MTYGDPDNPGVFLFFIFFKGQGCYLMIITYFTHCPLLMFTDKKTFVPGGCLKLP